MQRLHSAALMVAIAIRLWEVCIAAAAMQYAAAHILPLVGLDPPTMIYFAGLFGVLWIFSRIFFVEMAAVSFMASAVVFVLSR